MSTGFTLFDTPIGTCSLVWKDETVVGLRLPEASAAATRGRIKRRWPDAEEQAPSAAMRKIIDRVLALLAGKSVDLRDVPLDFGGAPEFHRRAYEIARTIPPGQTMTYGEIAKRLGVPHESREVGQAMGRNPIAIIMPCHRVLGADDFTGAARSFDEGIAQAFERAAGSVGEGQSHAPIMSWRLCHSSVRHRYQLATVR